MEKNTAKMNLSIVDVFRKKYPDLNVKKPKWAEFGITEEFRRLAVGEIVLFPLASYNYTTIRATPGGVLVKEKVTEGRGWRTKVDYDNKSVAVIRIS